MVYMGTILVFQGERPVFLREQSNHMYGTTAYYLSKVVGEMPLMVVAPLVYTAIIYFAIGFTRSVSHFFCFYLVLESNVQAAAGLGYCLASVF